MRSSDTRVSIHCSLSRVSSWLAFVDHSLAAACLFVACLAVDCLAVNCLAGSAFDSCGADNNSELSCDEFCAGILNDTTDMNDADFEEQWIQRMTATIAAAAPAAGLKYHIYDHCPFCIRGAQIRFCYV